MARTKQPSTRRKAVLRAPLGRRETRSSPSGPPGMERVSLLTMNLDGSDKVTTDPAIPTLNLFIGATSSDGRVLAFEAVDETSPTNTGLWVASPTLKDARRVTPLLDGWNGAAPLGVTPDGSRILFFTDTGPLGGVTHAGDLYVINSDGAACASSTRSGASSKTLACPSPVCHRTVGRRHSAWTMGFGSSTSMAVRPRRSRRGPGMPGPLSGHPRASGSRTRASTVTRPRSPGPTRRDR